MPVEVGETLIRRLDFLVGCSGFKDSNLFSRLGLTISDASRGGFDFEVGSSVGFRPNCERNSAFRLIFASLIFSYSLKSLSIVPLRCNMTNLFLFTAERRSRAGAQFFFESVPFVCHTNERKTAVCEFGETVCAFAPNLGLFVSALSPRHLSVSIFSGE